MAAVTNQLLRFGIFSDPKLQVAAQISNFVEDGLYSRSVVVI